MDEFMVPLPHGTLPESAPALESIGLNASTFSDHTSMSSCLPIEGANSGSSSSTSTYSNPPSAFRPILHSVPAIPNTEITETVFTNFINNILQANNQDLTQSTNHTTTQSSSEQSSEDSLKKCIYFCQICFDTASGFHYGVHACEGCKGFFRRSIQQKIKYRPCSKTQECAIIRNNRNRCQACRLSKCLRVGMSKDGVRFGRVPKKAKEKLAEEMQKAYERSNIDILAVELEDEQAFVTAIETAFQELKKASNKAVLPTINQKLCDLNSRNVFSWQISPLDSTKLYPLIEDICQFSKSIKGFHTFFTNDKVQLIKKSVLQIYLMQLSAMNPEVWIDIGTGALVTSNLTNYLFLHSFISLEEGKCLKDLILEFVDLYRTLDLNEKQQALLTAFVLCQPGSGTFTNSDLVQASMVKMVQEKLWSLLQASLLPASGCSFHDTLKHQVQLQSLITLPSNLNKLYKLHSDQLNTLSSQPPIQNQNLRSALSSNTSVLQNVSHPTPCQPISLLPSLTSPLPRPASTRSTCGTNAGSAPDDMPCLRKALERPSIITVNNKSPSVTTNLIPFDKMFERNEMVTTRKRTLSTISLNKNEVFKVENDEQEQPLNLCIRKI
uniref:Nuclear receptor domain-containing protein n=1 Tax=Rhabditophanes sp. KR3021 TaxID=114890 RepID=A0AC35U3C9_9BILA